jgi:GMP synthase (glutamine-hydrolysing)
MKRAICLQHVPFEGPGTFARALKARGYSIEPYVVPSDGLPPSPGDFLLVMGGPMSVNDPRAWISEELAFIREAVEAGTPFLGICLGSQLLAKAMGGRVFPGLRSEIGMTRISLTPEGSGDPAFAGAPAELDVFEWHGEGIELPAGAVRLATSSLFPVQAFRWKSRAYGLLFHLEVESANVRALCEGCPADLEKARLTAGQVMKAAEPELAGLWPLADRLVETLTGVHG